MNLNISAVSSRFGTTSRLVRAAWAVADADDDTPLARRVRGLLGELHDITRDREMCARFIEPGMWLPELRVEERDVCEHLADALSPHPV